MIPIISEGQRDHEILNANRDEGLDEAIDAFRWRRSGALGDEAIDEIR
jgi:hypothetical protein